MGGDLLRGPLGDHLPAAGTALGPHVDQPVRGLDHVQVVLDHHHRVAGVDQPAPTLSGGEAQRVKLASELQKRSTGRTLYVLDEPTTGLHFEDIRKLLGVLGRLVDAGNTVVVIEHNLDVIKTADWLIDMGPEGGSRGGQVIAEGTPEQIAAHPDSYTGEFLKAILDGRSVPVGSAQPELIAPPMTAAAKKAAAKAAKRAPARRRRSRRRRPRSWSPAGAPVPRCRPAKPAESNRSAGCPVSRARAWPPAFGQ